jgi:hypothetical protein
MGTTRAFYNILNTGFTPEDLRKKMMEISDFSKSKTSSFNKMFEQFISPEMLAQVKKETLATSMHFDNIFGQRARENRPVIAYRKTERWFPLFEEHLCEGNNASDSDLRWLNSIFDAPVLAFSTFDSDVLFISYIDDNKRVSNHAKTNYIEFEEYDAEYYSKDFPVFLFDFCGESEQNNLRDIWESESYDFADDRMYDMCVLLNIATLYSSNEIPEGYQAIFSDCF